MESKANNKKKLFKIFLSFYTPRHAAFIKIVCSVHDHVNLLHKLRIENQKSFFVYLL